MQRTPCTRSTTLPRPRPLHALRVCVACFLLFVATACQAQAFTCSLRSANSTANPFTITAQLQPSSGLARILGKLRVSCSFLGSLSQLNWFGIDIGASNSRGGMLERRARLITNTAVDMPYALTRYGTCASASTGSDWFDLGSSYTYAEEGSMVSSPSNFDLPFCVTAGYPNNGNLTIRAGTYRDSVRFTMNYSLTNNGRSYSGTTTLDMMVEVTVTGGCIVSSSPIDVAMSYTAFSTVTQTVSRQVGVTCSPGLAWRATVPSPSGKVGSIELPYSVALSSGQGSGSGAQQLVGVAVQFPPNVSGKCAGRKCTETLPINVEIAY